MKKNVPRKSLKPFVETDLTHLVVLRKDYTNGYCESKGALSSSSYCYCEMSFMKERLENGYCEMSFMKERLENCYCERASKIEAESVPQSIK